MTLALDENLMECDGEVVYVDMLCPWWIYVLEPNIVGFHDLTFLLMHDNIMIDKLMTWIMMTEVVSH